MKRRHSRRIVISTIEFSLDPLMDDLMDGVMIDVSDSGFCLLTSKYLMKGQIIKMQGDISESPKTATVRWSERHDNLYSKAGLEFV